MISHWKSTLRKQRLGTQVYFSKYYKPQASDKIKGRVAPGFARDGKTEKAVKSVPKFPWPGWYLSLNGLVKWSFLALSLDWKVEGKVQKPLFPMNFCPGTKQVSLVQQFSFYGDIFPFPSGTEKELESIQYSVFFFPQRERYVSENFSLQ